MAAKSSDSEDIIENVEKKIKETCNHPASRYIRGNIKGHGGYRILKGNNYKINIDTSPVCQVNVIDKTARSAKAAAKNLPTKGDWVFRLDKPHRGADFNHVNINPAISGRPDPHLPISSNALKVGKGTAKFCKVMNKANKVAVPVAITVDAVCVGIAVHDDIKNKTSRNTVETAVGIAGGWGGGFGGAAGGAAIGTAIFPGIGTIIGGIAGGLIGGITGSLGASKTAELIGDACDYDIDIIKCEKCGEKFKVRRYKGEKHRTCCADCSN